jgi:MFS family permease
LRSFCHGVGCLSEASPREVQLLKQSCQVLATKFGMPWTKPERSKGHRGAAGSVEQTADVLCVEIEVHKHMDDQSVAQRQSGSLGKSSFAITILAVCFMLSVLGRGLIASFSVFLLPISGSFGWSRGQIISIDSLASLGGALTSPLIGRMFDRCGPRVLYSLGFVVLGGAFLVAAYGQQLWQFQLSLGLCVGLGGASIGIVPHSVLLGRWFGSRLPTALAVVHSAAGAGVLMLLPVSQLLIDHVGWRGAYQVFGGVVLLLLVPLLLLPWKRFSAGSPALGKAAAADLLDDSWTLRRAIRHHAFWGLFSTFFFTAVGMFSISAQVVPYLVDAGFSQLQAATAWGFSGLALLFSRFLIAWLDGIIGRLRSLLFSYALSISGIAMLWLLRSYPNVWLLTGFVVSFGATVGSRTPLISAIAIKLFRGKQIATIYGTILFGAGLGSALGSLSGGLIHDFSGGYDSVLVFALINVLVGMIPFLMIPALR